MTKTDANNSRAKLGEAEASSASYDDDEYGSSDDSRNPTTNLKYTVPQQKRSEPGTIEFGREQRALEMQQLGEKVEWAERANANQNEDPRGLWS